MARKKVTGVYEPCKLTKELAKKLLAEHFPVSTKDLVKVSGTVRGLVVYEVRFGDVWVEIQNDALSRNGCFELQVRDGAGTAGGLVMYIDAVTFERQYRYEKIMRKARNREVS